MRDAKNAQHETVVQTIEYADRCEKERKSRRRERSGRRKQRLTTSESIRERESERARGRESAREKSKKEASEGRRERARLEGWDGGMEEEEG
eukprot:1209692-Pleurochrysis_carterae.AAC.3